MMKLVVLSCVFAAAAANAPFYGAPVAINIPASFGYGLPLQPYNAAHLTINGLNNGLHTLKKRSVTRLAVAPGPFGLSTAFASGNVGISAPISINPIGYSAIATNSIGISTPFTTGSLATPILAGSPGFSFPIAGVSTPINSPLSLSNPIAVSAPLTTGSFLGTSSIAIGTGVSASTAPIIRSF